MAASDSDNDNYSMDFIVRALGIWPTGVQAHSATLAPLQDSLKNTVIIMSIVDLCLRLKDFVLNGVHSSVVCNPELLLGSLILTMLKLRLAILAGDYVMLGVYVVGTIFHIAHMAFVFKFVPLSQKNTLGKKCLAAGATIAVLMCYSVQDDSTMLETRLGYIVLATIIVSHAMKTLYKWDTPSQATSIWTISLLTPIAWVAYGLATANILTVSQNALMFAFNLMNRYRYRPHLSLRYALTFSDWRAAHGSRVSLTSDGSTESLRPTSPCSSRLNVPPHDD